MGGHLFRIQNLIEVEVEVIACELVRCVQCDREKFDLKLFKLCRVIILSMPRCILDTSGPE